MAAKPHSRRRFLKFAGVGVVAVAAGIGYLARDYWSPSMPSPTTPSPTSLPTETPTVKPLKVAFDYSPKYEYILQDPNQIIEFKNLTEYSIDTKPVCEWRIDDRIVSEDWSISTKITPGKHSITLTARDGKTSDWASKDVEVDEFGLEYPEKELNVKIKGLCYIVGVPEWLDPVVPISRMDEDLTVIHEELGCNGIRIEGSIDEQILECGKIAIDKGFEYVALNARYVDATLDDYLRRVEAFAEKAEKLREKSHAIILQPATELSLDSRAVFQELSYSQRCENLVQNMSRNPDWNWKLNKCLDQLLQVCRRKFNGKIAYNKMVVEKVDWSKLDFDIVGSNEYFYPNRQDSIVSALEQLKLTGKPALASEFGSCTYDGACKYGGSGWLRNGLYSEEAQANCIKKYLEIYNQVKLYGCFLVYYYQVTHQWRSKEQTFSIMKPELPSYLHKLTRKKAFYMYKSYKRVGS